MSGRRSGAQVEEHLTYAEAAARLSVSPDTIRRLVRRGPRDRHGRPGIWPARRVSRQVVLIPASAINRYLEAITIV